MDVKNEEEKTAEELELEKANLENGEEGGEEELGDELTPGQLEGGEEEGDGDPGKTYYTPEEMRALDPLEVDTSRIPPEMEPFYRSMQSGYTRKFQELAEARKILDAKPEPEAEKPRDIHEAYRKDSKGVISAINAEIDKQEEIDPYDEGYPAARKEIRRLEALKDDLRESRQAEFESSGKMRASMDDFVGTLTREFKDWPERRNKLTDYATKTLGYTMEELAEATDPSRIGKDKAMKFIKSVNRAYELENVGTTLGKRKVANKPTKVEKPGSGLPETKGTDDYNKLLEIAKKTGRQDDWVKVNAKKRELASGK